MLLKEKKYKLKFCRECQETWILTWDDSGYKFFGGDFDWWDVDFDWHRLVCGTKKIVRELQKSMGRLNETKN